MCPATTPSLPEPEPVPKNHLRLTFGVPSEPELIEGARRLAAGLPGSALLLHPVA